LFTRTWKLRARPWASAVILCGTCPFALFQWMHYNALRQRRGSQRARSSGALLSMQSASRDEHFVSCLRLNLNSRSVVSASLQCCCFQANAAPTMSCPIIALLKRDGKSVRFPANKLIPKNSAMQGMRICILGIPISKIKLHLEPTSTTIKCSPSAGLNSSIPIPCTAKLFLRSSAC
jgi:hypothetical protein